MKRWALLLLLCVLMSGCGISEPDPAPEGGPVRIPLCDEPVYDVELYEGGSVYEAAPLYLATLDAPEPVWEMNEKFGGEQSVPVSVFATVGDHEASKNEVGSRFWLLDVQNGAVVNTFFVHAEYKGACSTTACVSALNSLAHKTSEESPLFLVNGGDFLFFVVDNTAYCISEYALEYVPDALPELYLGDGEVNVIKIE